MNGSAREGMGSRRESKRVRQGEEYGEICKAREREKKKRVCMNERAGITTSCAVLGNPGGTEKCAVVSPAKPLDSDVYDAKSCMEAFTPRLFVAPRCNEM